MPNFLCREQVSLGKSRLKQPFVVHDGYIDLPTGVGVELDDAMLDR